MDTVNDGEARPRSSGARLGVAIAAACALVLGGVTLLGWSIEATALISIARDLPSMVPNTAVSLVLAGGALWILGGQGRPARLRWLGQACAAAVIALGLGALVQYVLAWDLGLDRLLFPERVDFPAPFPGRPSPNTALCLVLVGAALLSLPVPSRRGGLIAEGGALASAALALTALTGYVFGVGYFYGMPPLFPFTGMALHTAIGLLALTCGILMARVDGGALNALTDGRPGGVLLRRLLPCVVLAPLALGRLFLLGADLGAYPIAASLSLASALTTLLLGSVLWVSAARLNALDEARSRAEAARALLATVVQCSDDAVIGHTFDGTVLCWNPAAERLYGHSAGEVIGKKLPVLSAPERAGEAEALVARLRRGERIEHFETVGRTRDGRDIDVEVTMSPILDGSDRILGVSMICRDIRRRKAMEAEVARLYRVETDERKRLQAVIDQLPEAVVLVDGRGQIITCNRLALAYASRGSSERDPLGNPLRFDYRTPDGAPVPWAERPVIQALLHGEVVTGVEALVARDDGELVPVLVSAAPVRSDGGEIQGAVTVFQDIAAIKEMERQREEWTGVIAHDLRQPLQAIATASQLVRLRLGQPFAADMEKQFGRISSSVEWLRRMIDDLLDASRIEARQLSLEVRPVDLRAQLEEILERSAAATEGHAVGMDVQGDVPAVLADPGRIEQIVTNLLSNAAKYGEPARDILVAVRAEGPCAQVSVTNWGRGIPEAFIPHLFKRFWRSPESGAHRVRGVGLGLYITQGLVEAHGGTISAESSPGGATTFRFTLPFATEASRAAGDGETSARQRASRR
ncbi:PAS domain S-box protein [Sorangium sp. So ce1036]|uniref:sensor histidine kinase n=1 Tax=Sorangium sp. So ce1036 TaxID=3133328 RepID=UPI003F09A2AA